MLIDISQEVLSCAVYPGDPKPALTPLLRIADGASYDLSALSLCVHNGTHVDAPFHFLRDGKTVEQLPLEAFVGDCYLARCQGDVTAADAAAILQRAEQAGADSRILIAGRAVVTAEAARVFAAAGLLLLGCEGLSVGPVDAPMEVHKLLLGAEVALLEGIVLGGLDEGRYFLNAAPLNIAGADGSPCRAWLMKP